MADEPRALPEVQGNPFSGMAVLNEHAPSAGQPLQEYLGQQTERPWEEVAPDIQRHFGVEPSDELREQHRVLGRRRQQDIQIAQAREAASREGEPLLHAEFRRLPFFRTGQALGENMRYGQAIERFRNYQATPEDMAAIARYENWQRIEGQEGFGEKLLTLPAMAAEMLAGGRAAQSVAPALAPGASLGQQALRTGTQLGVTTAAMPEMWAPEWTRANVQAGRDTFDPRGLGKPLLNAYIQAGILHSLGALGGEGGLAGALERRVGLAGTGIGQLAGQTGTRAALGSLEQEIADATTHAAGLNAGYGPLTDLALGHGDTDENLRRAAMNAITFAVAGNLHNANAEHLLRPIAERLGALHREGVPPAQAGREVDQAVQTLADRMQEAHNGPQDLTREQALEAAESYTGPQKAMLLAIARQFPRVQIPRVVHHEPFMAEEMARARPPEAPEPRPEGEAGPEAAQEPQTQRWRDTGTAFGPNGEFQGRNGRTYRVGEGEYQSEGWRQAGIKPIQATDVETGEKAGEVRFVPSEGGDTHFATGLRAYGEHRGQGVVEAMYDAFHRQVGPIEPSKSQTAGTPEQEGKGGGKGVWLRNAEHARAEDTVQRHLEDIHRIAPDVAMALYDTLRQNPHVMPEMAKALESPEFKKEVQDAAASSARSRGWPEASIRRALGERLPQSAQSGEAPAPGEGGGGGKPPKAPEGEPPAAGDSEKRGAGGTPAAPVGRPASSYELTREGLVQAFNDALARREPMDMSHFKKLKLDELRQALKDLGIAGRPISKADAIRKIEQVLTTQAEMAGKVKEIQGDPLSKLDLHPDILQIARDTWASGDPTHYNDFEAAMPPDDFKAIKKALGKFTPNPEAANTSEGLRGVNAQARADVERRQLEDTIERLYHEHEANKTAGTHGPEAASALREGLQDGVRDAEGEANEGTPEQREAAASGGEQGTLPFRTPGGEQHGRVPRAGFGAPLVPGELGGMIGGGQEGGEPTRPLTEHALANAKIDEERQARGDPPLMSQARQANQESWDKAMATLDRDPQAGAKLVDELTKKPRATTVEENALLLHRKIVLDNEWNRQFGRYMDLRRQGGSAEEVEAHWQQVMGLLDQINQVEKVARQTGTEWGRAGQFRRQLAREDFSLGNMMNQFRAAIDREPTQQEVEEISRLHAAIAALRQRAEEAERALGALRRRPGEDLETAANRAALSPEWRAREQAQGQLAAGEEQFRSLVNRARDEHKSWPDKMQDWLTRWVRFNVLSHPKTFVKLAAAAVSRGVVTPMEDMLGGALRLIPGVRGVAEKAPRQGGAFDWTAEQKAWVAAFTDGLKDAVMKVRAGQSELGAAEGGEWYSRGMQQGLVGRILDLPGLLHGAFKAPVERMEYTRSFLRRQQWVASNGGDPTSPTIMAQNAAQAYLDAQRSIFMNRNAVTNAWNSAIARLQQSGAGGQALATAMRVTMPIVRVPTNIVGEVIEHALGTVTGSVRLAQAYRAGIERLEPQQADLIMRNLKKGSLGMAAMLVGYFAGPGLFGGFYSGKRKDNEQEPGTIGPVPAVLLHNPFVMAGQLGASVRREQDRVSGKKGHKEEQGIASGLMGGALELAGELPFMRSARTLAELGNPQERGRAFGDYARTLSMPLFLQFIGDRIDAMQAGSGILAPAPQRQPQTIFQNVQMGIPGLRQNVPLRPIRQRR